jgi:hypothetical protein
MLVFAVHVRMDNWESQPPLVPGFFVTGASKAV